MNQTLTRRTFTSTIALTLGGSIFVRSASANQSETPSGTPDPELPTPLCLPADDGECLRGTVPTSLAIAAIGVDAPVEILEVVGGVMQQPSDEVHVAWYKESSRLGEIGNVVIAGHLNWWGFPEAVFFNLGTLLPDDEVVLVDDQDQQFTYRVEWVRQESNLEPPTEDALGMPPYQALTLITCGGNWDNSISEYNERTVVRARIAEDDGSGT